jgi:hypothetical protein
MEVGHWAREGHGVLGDGATRQGEYAGWADDEPNDNGGEDYAEIQFQEAWNDRSNDDSQGYLVEYGGLSGDPAVVAERTISVDLGAPVISGVGDHRRVHPHQDR